MSRELKFSEAVNEALDLCMASDPSVYILGLGVPDPKGVFGTTLNLFKKYGRDRVMDMPTSENGMTGVAIGSALAGLKPVMTHQRVDFFLLAMEQIVNQAAKWHYMFGGKQTVPLVIRLIVGRGWGQGPQHSQSLQAWFAHVPGLKVVMPTTPHDAKGLLISSIEDPNPVIFLEHRWLHSVTGPVPDGMYRVPLGTARVVRPGEHLTIASLSYMTLEAIKAAEMLEKNGVSAEVIDVRSLKPLDEETLLRSIQKTGRLIVADTAWKTGGFAGELIALAAEKAFRHLKGAPQRVTLPDCPTPTTPALSKHYYPRWNEIVKLTGEMLGRPIAPESMHANGTVPLDIPDESFAGPF